MPAISKIGLSEPLHFFSSTTITVPANVYKARVIVFGAGGSGAVKINTSAAGATGGAGGGLAVAMVNVTPGETATITVATGGRRLLLTQMAMQAEHQAFPYLQNRLARQAGAVGRAPQAAQLRQ